MSWFSTFIRSVKGMLSLVIGLLGDLFGNIRIS